MQFFSESEMFGDQNPPPTLAELPLMVQLVRRPPAAPPPASAVLLKSVQFISAAPYAPPPSNLQTLPSSVQFLSVPEYAPPPDQAAELAVSTQLETTALSDVHHTPPPLSSWALLPKFR